MISAGLAAYKLAYQLSPIIFTGQNSGITASIPGGMLPIIAITQALNFTTGLLSGPANLDLDDFFANFQPLPGSTLIKNQIGTYPFANQTVAANAIITQPLNISLMMLVPVRDTGGYFTKTATMLLLQKAFYQHNAGGGTYTIMTPSYFYTNCVMLAMSDVSSSTTKQAQMAYQLDFYQPLLTLTAALAAQSGLMNKLTNGLQTDGSTSGIGTTVGNTSPPGAAGATSPASSNLPGTGVSGYSNAELAAG